MNKKIIKGAVASALVAPLCVGLFAACSCSKSPTRNVNNVNAKEVYAMSAVTSANYLNGVTNSKVMGANVLLPLNDVNKSHLGTIDTYMGMFGTMLQDGINETKDTMTEEEKTTFKDFTKVLRIGKNKEYNLFYKELNSKTSTEVEDDETETETETTLTGIIVEKGKTEGLTVTGSKKYSEEREGNEIEVESEIVFTTKKDDKNYITVTQGFEVETEDGETENEVTYEYKVVTDGSVEVTEIEFEDENTEKELEIKIKDAEGKKTKYIVKKAAAENEYVVTLKGTTNIINLKVLPDGVTEFTVDGGTLKFKDGEEVIETPTSL